MWKFKRDRIGWVTLGTALELSVFYCGFSGDFNALTPVLLSIIACFSFALVVAIKPKPGVSRWVSIPILGILLFVGSPISMILSDFAFRAKTRYRLPSYVQCVEKFASKVGAEESNSTNFDHPCRGIYAMTIRKDRHRTEAWLVIATFPRVILVYSPNGSPYLLPGSRHHNSFGESWYWHAEN
jgi:hypothetical protein